MPDTYVLHVCECRNLACTCDDVTCTYDDVTYVLHVCECRNLVGASIANLGSSSHNFHASVGASQSNLAALHFQVQAGGDTRMCSLTVECVLLL